MLARWCCGSIVCWWCYSSEGFWGIKFACWRKPLCDAVYYFGPFISRAFSRATFHTICFIMKATNGISILTLRNIKLRKWQLSEQCIDRFLPHLHSFDLSLFSFYLPYFFHLFLTFFGGFLCWFLLAIMLTDMRRGRLEGSFGFWSGEIALVEKRNGDVAIVLSCGIVWWNEGDTECKREAKQCICTQISQYDSSWDDFAQAIFESYQAKF